MTDWILFGLACWIGLDLIFVWLLVRQTTNFERRQRSTAVQTVELDADTSRDPGPPTHERRR